MNSMNYFNYIEEKLSLLVTRVKTRGKLNILDLNVHSENFFAELFNLIYDYELINMNNVIQNAESIDLIDEKNKLLIQVSSISTKKKVENSLSKESMKKYSTYTFMFLPIIIDSSNLKSKTFLNPHSVSFDPKRNIMDISDILRKFESIGIRKQKMVYDFFVEEFGSDINIQKMDSSLTTLIQLLAEGELDYNPEEIETNSFQILKKISFNELHDIQYMIDDYKIYSQRLNQKYKEFDSMGFNKSLSVLQKIRKVYFICAKKTKDNCELFLQVIDEVKNIVKESRNFENISSEELELYIGIIVVDAFLKCKIFKNPEGYQYVAAR